MGFWGFGVEMEMEPAEEQQFPSKNTSRNVTVGAQFCSIVYDNLVSTNGISSEVLHTGTAITKGSAILSVDWACAVGGVSNDDTDGEQGNEEDEQGTFAIIDGGAVDNMFNVPEECWTTYVKSKATWGTARGTHAFKRLAKARSSSILLLTKTRSTPWRCLVTMCHNSQ